MEFLHWSLAFMYVEIIGLYLLISKILNLSLNL